MRSVTKTRLWLVFLVFSGLVWTVYSNTLNAPYYFDDFRSITHNPHIRLTEISYEKLIRAAFDSICDSRPIANISFALNYYFHQYRVAGYHLVNILIHLINGILLYLFIKTTLQLPSLRSRYDSYEPIAFFAALIWLAHPIQIQSVTYIVQRMTSMATMFYLLSFLLYVKGRLAKKNGGKWFYFISCGISWALALASKEISATLPFFILLYEWYFFQELNKSWLKRNSVYIVAILLLLGMITLVYIGPNPLERILSGYERRGFTLGERVLTESRVVIYYISLLIFPRPERLNLLHEFELSRSLLDPITTTVSMCTIVGLLVFAFYIAKKAPLVSFSIFWFFGNLAIESSVIALEIIFEHRTYLPSMFFCLLVAVILSKCVTCDWLKTAVLGTSVLVLCIWTYQRNLTWSDPAEFWSDVVRKSPHSARAHVGLAGAERDKGSYPEAIGNLKRAIDLAPNLTVAYTSMANIYIKQGQFDQAIEVSRNALDSYPNRYERHAIYKAMGTALREQGNTTAALDAHLKAVELVSTDAEVYDCLGSDYLARSEFDFAIKAYRKALEWDPFAYRVFNNLGMAYAAKGDIRKAAEMYRQAIAIKPDFVRAYSNLGSIYLNYNPKKAIPLLRKAIELDPTFADAYNNLGLALIKSGIFQPGRARLKRALSLQPNHQDATFNLARLYELTGQYELAVEQYGKSIRLNPDDVNAYQNAGSIYLNHLNNTQKAVRLFQKALSINPDLRDAEKLKGVIRKLNNEHHQ